MVLGFLERLERFYSIHTDDVDAGNSTGSGDYGRASHEDTLHGHAPHRRAFHRHMSQACIS
jgi:hypothetical protein